jgi:hypothetical protein
MSSSIFPIQLIIRFHFFFDERHPLEGSRAISDVLLIYMHVIVHILFGMVRKSSAVVRTNFVDAALVIFQVQELAGLFLVHPVTRSPLFVQPFLFEFFGGLVKVSRNAHQVFFGERGRHAAAAIGTFQAIGLFPGFLIGFLPYLLYAGNTVFLQFGEESTLFAFLQIHLLLESGYDAH